MAVNEEIVTGRKFRKLIDEATKLWQRISFWTKASDVEFDDGSTAETKMGAINGITDSLVSTSSNVAASAKALSELNNKLAHGQIEFDITSDGEGLWRAVGADTWSPFKKYDAKASAMGTTKVTSSSISITVPVGIKHGLLLCSSTGWMSGVYQDLPQGTGLKTIKTTKYKENAVGTCSLVIAMYECEFVPGGTLTLQYRGGSTGYPCAQMILLA